MQPIRHVRNAIVGVLLVFLLGACTPQEIALWEKANGLAPGEAKAIGDRVAAADAEAQAQVEAEPPREVEPLSADPAVTYGPSPQCPGSPYGSLIPQYFSGRNIHIACVVMKCESHVGRGDPATIVNQQGPGGTPLSTASGLFQFLDGTWRLVGKHYPEARKYSRAMHAPPEVQVQAAAIWLSKTSWSQWHCYTLRFR